jgi:hypothetical protein
MCLALNQALKQAAVDRQPEVDAVLQGARRLDSLGSEIAGGSQTALVNSQLVSRYQALCSNLQVFRTVCSVYVNIILWLRLHVASNCRSVFYIIGELKLM